MFYMVRRVCCGDGADREEDNEWTSVHVLLECIGQYRMHLAVAWDAVLTDGPQSRAQPSFMGISTTVTSGVSSK